MSEQAVSPPGPLVLVVEDEAPVRRFLRAALTSNGYRIFECESGADAISQAAARNPDVVLLDLGLPDRDGLEVTRRLREWSHVPILVVSARGQERDKVDALDAGADDYVTKPFGVAELLARIRVALRHSQATETGDPIFEVGDFKVDLGKRLATVAGEEVHLTPTEYRLLSILIRHAGKVVTHRQLLQEAWGAAHGAQVHYLRVYMAQLRHKLEPDPARPKRLLTEPGVGYRLRDEG